MLLVVFILILCPVVTYGQLDTLRNSRYTVVYSYYYKLPIKVTWKLYKTDVVGEAKRGKMKFKTDSRLRSPRISSGDYTNSGYQRGHMCPAADWVSSISLMKETFLMSNVVPQSPGLNNGQWKEDEYLTRALAVLYDSIVISCGPIFDPMEVARFGRKQIAIPPRFWKEVKTLGNDSVLLNRYYVNR